MKSNTKSYCSILSRLLVCLVRIVKIPLKIMKNYTKNNNIKKCDCVKGL